MCIVSVALNATSRVEVCHHLIDSDVQRQTSYVHTRVNDLWFALTSNTLFLKVVAVGMEMGMGMGMGLGMATFSFAGSLVSAGPLASDGAVSATVSFAVEACVISNQPSPFKFYSFTIPILKSRIPPHRFRRLLHLHHRLTSAVCVTCAKLIQSVIPFLHTTVCGECMSFSHNSVQDTGPCCVPSSA